jgi:hypothetical protein
MVDGLAWRCLAVSFIGCVFSNPRELKSERMKIVNASSSLPASRLAPSIPFQLELASLFYFSSLLKN